jgi:hypothetical protein
VHAELWLDARNTNNQTINAKTALGTSFNVPKGFEFGDGFIPMSTQTSFECAAAGAA